MRILDKYILKELSGIFLFGMAAFSSIFIGSSVMFRIAQYMSQYGTPLGTVAKLFVFSLPEIVNYTFPMSMLLAALLAVGRLSGNSELTAMKSGGISIYRIAAPIFIAAFAISIFSVVFAEKVVPISKAAYRYVLHYDVLQNTKPRSQEHVVIKSVSGGNIERLTYARSFNEGDGEMRGITIEDFEQGKLARIQNAEKAIWKNNAWYLQNGHVFTIGAGEGVQQTMEFKEQIIPLSETPRAISQEQKERDEMTISELRSYMKVLERRQQPIDKYLMEMYQRVTIPMACFVFAVIGVPLGMQPQRASSSIGLGISIIIIFIYYTIMTITTALGQGGVIPPLLAAWIPNICCLGAGIWLMKQKNQ